MSMEPPLGAFPCFDQNSSEAASTASRRTVAAANTAEANAARQLQQQDEAPRFAESFGTSFPVIFEQTSTINSNSYRSSPSQQQHQRSPSASSSVSPTSSTTSFANKQKRYRDAIAVVSPAGLDQLSPSQQQKQQQQQQQDPSAWFRRGSAAAAGGGASKESPEAKYRDFGDDLDDDDDVADQISHIYQDSQDEDDDDHLGAVLDGAMGHAAVLNGTTNRSATADESSEFLDDGQLSVRDDVSTTGEGSLLWRMDPKNSWSDWTIVVTTECSSSSGNTKPTPPTAASSNASRGSHSNSSHNSASTTTATPYHVHKALLASGPRRSLFFRRLFQSNDASASQSEITLPPLSAQAFPLFLDLIYDQNLHVQHGDENTKRHVVGLYELAEMCQVTSLIQDIRRQFIPCITLSEARRYYTDAVSFDPPVDSFLDHILDLCTQNVLDLDPGAPLLQALEPGFLLGILETERRRRDTKVTTGADAVHISRHLSKLVVGYAEHCEDAELPLSDETLEVLTREENVPSVDFNVVLDYASTVIPKIQRLMETNKDYRSENPALSLQLRCLESLKWNISKLDLDNPANDYRAFLKTLPSDLAVDAVLELKSLGQQAQTDIMDRENGRLRERNAALESVKRQHKSEIHSLSAECEELQRDLRRFELVSPASAKKSAMKKVNQPVSGANLPPGVKIQALDGGHMECSGKLLFALSPKSVTRNVKKVSSHAV